MRSTVLLRRLLGSAVGTLLATGVLVLGVAAPASADPPEVRFEDRCGAVAFTWDTGTIGSDETWATTVLRGDVVVEEFDMRSRGDRVYAARDGDIFEMRREGLHPASFVHRAPDGCAGGPALTVTATSECSSLLLAFTNTGDTPVTGLQVLLTGVGARDVPPLDPGSVDLRYTLADGAGFYVRGPLAGGGWADWLSGTYQQPADCASEPATPPASGDPDPSPDESSPGTAAPGDGGGLPVTGAQSALFSVAGVLLVGIGAALFLAARRRRLRFTSTIGQ